MDLDDLQEQKRSAAVKSVRVHPNDILIEALYQKSLSEEDIIQLRGLITTKMTENYLKGDE